MTPRAVPTARACRVAIVAILALALAVARGAQAQAPTATFPSEVEVVTLDVVVVDKAGHPVADLSRDELVVEEDGRPQEIVSFERIGAAAPAPVPAPAPPADALTPRIASNAVPPAPAAGIFAVIVDDLGLGQREAADTRAALVHFVNDSVRDGDLVTLSTTSGSAWWTTTIPQGRADLQAVVARLQGRVPGVGNDLDFLSDYEAFAIRDHDDAGTLDRVIRRWTATGACPRINGRPDPACPSRIRSRAADIDGVRRVRTRVVLTTVRRTLDALALSRGRKSVLLFSPGFLRDAESAPRELEAAARDANAAVYFIDARGLQALSSGMGAADAGPQSDPATAGRRAFEGGVLESEGAQTLADETGGLSFRNSNDLAVPAARVAEESHLYYLVGIHPPPGRKPGDWRKLKASVTRPGLTVRARQGYRVQAAAAEPAPRAKGADKGAGKASPATVASLDSAQIQDGVPLRAMAYVFEPGAKKLARVLVAAEIDPRGLQFAGAGESRAAQLDLGLAVTERDTGHMQEAHERVEVRAPAGDAPGWRSVGREFELPPGVFQARVVVRDPQARTVGAVSYRFEVPRPDELHLTTPIVTDQVERGASGDRPRPAVAIHRTFTARGHVFCEFEVIGAQPAPTQKAPVVSAGVELVRVPGEVVRKGEPTPITPDARGRLVRLIGIGVDGLPEGDYELVVSVLDQATGAHLERREPFALVTPR